MGLDMYLYRRRYVQNWEFNKDKPKRRWEITIKRGDGREYDASKVTEITEQVVYWRKANAIHGWFVKNVQNGEDDCGRYDVSREQLEELLGTIRTVLKTRDHELLPRADGFFFGSREDADEWYWEDLRETEKALSELLADPDNDFKDYGTWFTYQSSW